MEKILGYLSIGGLVSATGSVVMIEFGFTHWIGNWKPSYEAATAYAAISIAATCLVLLAMKDKNNASLMHSIC